MSHASIIGSIIIAAHDVPLASGADHQVSLMTIASMDLPSGGGSPVYFVYSFTLPSTYVVGCVAQRAL